MSDLREVVEGLLAGKVYADGGLKWRMRDNRVQYQSSLSEGWFTSGLGLNEIARRDFVEYKEPLSHTEAIEELMKPDGKLMLREVVEGLFAGKVYKEKNDPAARWRLNDGVLESSYDNSDWREAITSFNALFEADLVEHKEPLSHTEALEVLLDYGKLTNAKGDNLYSFAGQYFTAHEYGPASLSRFLNDQWFKGE